MLRPQLVPFGEYVVKKTVTAISMTGGWFIALIGGITIVFSLVTVILTVVWAAARFQYCVFSDMAIPLPTMFIAAIAVLGVAALGCAMVKLGSATMDEAAGAPEIHLMTRSALNALPPAEALVRAADRPVTDDRTALVRAASEPGNTSSDDALRPATVEATDNDLDNQANI